MPQSKEQQYRKPILAYFYEIIGVVVTVIAGVILVVWALLQMKTVADNNFSLVLFISSGLPVASVFLVGLFILGIGEFFDMVGKTAFYTQRTTEICSELCLIRSNNSETGKMVTQNQHPIYVEDTDQEDAEECYPCPHCEVEIPVNRIKEGMNVCRACLKTFQVDPA